MSDGFHLELPGMLHAPWSPALRVCGGGHGVLSVIGYVVSYGSVLLRDDGPIQGGRLGHVGDADSSIG